MTQRNVLRAAVVTIAFVVSCNVYDSSLLVASGGASGAGAGARSSSGGTTAGGGLGGKPGAGSAALDDNGGLSNETGEAGITGEGDSIVVPGTGGAGTGGASGSSGTPGKGGSAALGGSAGSAGKGGSASGGSAGSTGKGGSASGGNAGSAGKGGTAGAGTSGGGSSGALGTSGAGAGGGSSGGGAGGKSGAGGSSGTGGTGGSTVTANGCASLSVPLVATSNKARFVISLANATNFSSAIVTMRVYVKAGSGGVITSYVQDPAYNLLKNTTPAGLDTLAGWQTLTWNIAAQGAGSSGISLSSVARVGIEINAAPDSSWTNPTLVYVDSLTVSSPALSFSFDNSSTVNPTPSLSDLSGQVLWQNSSGVDTTASNVTLNWLASCP